MEFLVIIGVAIALAMDSLSVSVINGFFVKKLRFGYALKVAFFFGFFQALMPLIGWRVGIAVKSYIQRYDHWIAFVLLAFIGIRMIADSSYLNKREKMEFELSLPALLMLSLATSIDAMAVGISFALLNVGILISIATIGLITFSLCLVGVYAGNRCGYLFENKIGLTGGIILILIGIKILVEHTVKKI